MDLNRLAAAFAPRVAAFVIVGIATTAGVTWAASHGVMETPPTPTVATAAPVPPLVVPDVTQQAFVFAKGALEDAGFAWRVVGSVHGYAANTVVSQTPSAGMQVVDTGAPLITLTLKRNAGYPQLGQSEDASPYEATAIQPAATEGGTGPALPATTTRNGKDGKPTTSAKGAATTKSAKPATKPAKPATKPATQTTTTATTKTAKAAPPATATSAHSSWPKSRPAAFTVPGGKTEPLDEMPLPDRAAALGRWLEAHPAKTTANVRHWLYQNHWIVSGARLGWWHGAEALKTLADVDKRAQALWGIGAKSAALAEQALRYAESRSSQ